MDDKVDMIDRGAEEDRDPVLPSWIKMCNSKEES